MNNWLRHSGIGAVLMGLLVVPMLATGAPRPTADKPTADSSVGWTLDLDKMKVPDKPAAGKWMGGDFAVEKVQLNPGGVLILRQGKEFFADADAKIFLFLKQGESLEGKSYVIGATSKPGESRPHVHFARKGPGDKLPKGSSTVNGYAMRLEFGKAKDGKLPGQIYLCLPDADKSYVAGTFVLEVK